MSGIRGSGGTLGVVWAILSILRDEWYKGLLWNSGSGVGQSGYIKGGVVYGYIKGGVL